MSARVAVRTDARFDILVLNFERIHLFLDNFEKIRHFDPTRDRIIVLDCSRDPADQRRKVQDFTRSHGFTPDQVLFRTRPNWGLAEGARVDYLTELHEDLSRAPYVWQFQEHYLDNTSPYSRFDSGEFAGQVKGDVLPDGLALDLDLCERAFLDEAVSVIFADRTGIGILGHPDGREWFFADGGNLCFRTSKALEAFPRATLDDYKLVFDASYRWAQFFEFEFSRALANGHWFDLVRERSYRNPAHALSVDGAACTRANERYIRWIDRYEGRMKRVRALPSSAREVLLATMFPAVGAFQTKVFAPIRSKLLARGMDSPKWLRELW